MTKCVDKTPLSGYSTNMKLNNRKAKTEGQLRQERYRKTIREILRKRKEDGQKAEVRFYDEMLEYKN